MRERMAADFEDSSMRDELLSFHRAAMALRNDPAVLSCFRSGRDEPGLPWITETSRAMHCYLRDTDELPERAVLVFKASRYFLTVDWLLPGPAAVASSPLSLAIVGLPYGSGRLHGKREKSRP